MNPVLDHSVAGPSEADWARVCRTLPLFAWPRCRRVVVVSPHPDDETLGVGGVICAARERAMPVVVLLVTDGEAASSEPDLAAVRSDELHRALACLDPFGGIQTVRLGFPDSDVTANAASLTARIAEHLRPGDLVVCPLPDDGHPDHAATSTAATDAANTVGALVLWFPVWAWQCHDPQSSMIRRGERQVLTDEMLARKQRAVACYVSQTEGPDPVVPPAMLTRLLRPFEVVVSPR